MANYNSRINRNVRNRRRRVVRRNNTGINTVNLPYDGTTTNKAGHTHTFTIRVDKTVIINDAIHPQEPRIKHSHQYIGKWPDGYVTNNASACYPRCKQRYGIEGAGPHNHKLLLTNQINEINKSGKTRMVKGNQKQVVERTSKGINVKFE